MKKEGKKVILEQIEDNKKMRLKLKEIENKERLELLKRIEEEQKTLELLEGYSKMSDKEKLLWGEKVADAKNLYKNDYLGISNRTGQATFNYLVKVADKRAYDVTRKEYIDEITIKKGIGSIGNADVEVINGNIEIELQGVYSYLVSEFDKDKDFVRRMKLLCDIDLQYPNFFTTYANSPIQVLIPMNYQNYINTLGFEKIRALSYHESNIISYIKSQDALNMVDITSIFNVGDKISKKDIKKILGDFYTSNNISKTPKASDLGEYFIVKSIKLKVGDKWENGFEIIALKSS